MAEEQPGPDSLLALVVDDEIESRDLVCEILAADGFRTLAAADGEEALALAGAHRPSLIVMDVMMRTMDGYTALTRLRGDPATRDIPVIILTGQEAPLYRTLSFGVGATAHLTKPFSPALLTAAVWRALGRGGSTG
ncbi:MAG: response regulator [Candidatus Rokubacteria bacterium]|nr:response regulator [Candidatus Rokubacteria bacterium]